MKDLITIEAICDRYQCERHKAATILYKLPHMKVGNRLFAYKRDLEEWERGQMNYPAAKGVRTQKGTQYRIPRRRA